MGVKIIKYTAVLVAVYLVVAHATDAGNFLLDTSKGYSGAVQALQGRGK